MTASQQDILSTTTNLADTLQQLASALGLDQKSAIAWETADKLTYENANFDAERAANLDLPRIAFLLQPFRSVVRCRFYLPFSELADPEEEQHLLDIVQKGSNPTALDTFRQRIVGRRLVFDFQLDKRALLKGFNIKAPNAHLILYIFPEALFRFLSGRTTAGKPTDARIGLQALEQVLWPPSQRRKILLLVPAQEVALDGTYLAVAGGSAMVDLAKFSLAEPPDYDHLRTIYDQCRETVTWDESWLRRLTPPHLHVVAQGAETAGAADLADALRGHLVNLSLLYTANRTAEQPRGFVATYWDSQTRADMILSPPDDQSLEQPLKARVGLLYKAFRWAYESKWPRDRISFVQSTIAQELIRQPTKNAYQILANAGKTILNSLERRWDQFVRHTLAEYSEEKLALDKYAGETADTFAEQVAEMIKSVSDTMLAAIAALLGSFLAAGFNQNTFNSQIFTIGMAVYAVYVLLFPLAYNMSSQWLRYKALEDRITAILAGFRGDLGNTPVDTIEARWIKPGRKRFRRWFALTVAVYLLAIIFGLAAAFIVPQFI
jgi:hypothetical protein